MAEKLTDERLREIEAGNTDQPIGYNPLVREARMMARELLALRTTGEAVAPRSWWWEAITDDNHKLALLRIDDLMEELEALSGAVEAYEARRFPIAPPTPEEAAAFRAEQEAAHPPAPQPEVKALEWREEKPKIWRATSMLGRYTIIQETARQSIWWGPEPTNYVEPVASTLEAAKAAAQADFDRRIRSALVGGGA